MSAPEHVDVLILGAGLSGIGAGYHVQTECPWASYTILEAREAIGGTWDLFRYPGIRSDSDMFTLGYSFRPWTGEKSIADGQSILDYIRDTATETGVADHIRFGHRVLAAEWSTAEACWLITAERTDTGDTVLFTCGWLFSCSGYYRYDKGHQPEFPGAEDFTGTIVHPQFWPEDLDHSGRQVVVIGSGATAITLVPSLAETAAHVTMLQRSPTYVASLPAKNPVADLMRRVLPQRWAGPLIRWYLALVTQASFAASRRWPAAAKRLLRKGVQVQLPDDYDIDTHFTPRYDPWDQRLCVAPNGDLFAAIRSGTASVVTDHVETFTESGIRLRSGAHLDADVIVTATGLEMLFMGGVDLLVDGIAVDVTERLTYKGMMLEDVPNLSFAVGYTNASWTLKCELTTEVVCRILNHMRASRMRQAMPSRHGRAVAGAPLLELTSGYVQRGAAHFPQQGAVFPWRVYQSYLRDYRALKSSGVIDDTLDYSNPQPTERTTVTRSSEVADGPHAGASTAVAAGN